MSNVKSQKRFLNPYIILLIVIIITGFLFRFKGIADNHSFWSDEAFVSSFSRDIVLHKKSLIDGMKSIWYEPFQIFTTAVFFKIFGITEFSARLPSVFFGTLGIIFAFLAVKSLSNSSGGLLAAFLFAFSQLNLANSTQAKPYAALQTLLIILLYVLIKIRTSHRKWLEHFFAILFIIFIGLIHRIGIIIWILYLSYVLFTFLLDNKKKLNLTFVLILFTLLLIIMIPIGGYQEIINFLKSINGKSLFSQNNFMYLKNLFIRQYGMFVLPATAGLLLIYKKNRPLVIGIAVYIFFLLFLWNFYAFHNIRYLVSLFGIIFVFFGVFWAKVRDTFILPLVVLIILMITQYKIVLKPMNYYSPNADFYGDVQVADYKDMFKFIREKIPDYQHIALFNDLIDTQRWYLPEKTPNALFTKGSKNSSLDDFLKEKDKYLKGILIVEDWESFLPEDIKEYAKKNMKLEIKVDSLAVAKNDPWPLEVYSWGLD